MSRLALLCLVAVIIMLRDHGYLPRALPQTAPAAEGAPIALTPREQWAIDLLAALGNAQPTPATIAMVVEWTIAEDGSDGALNRQNPLNTTMCGHHQTGAINGDGACGVAGYASYQDGIDATIDTLNQANFSSITAALLANDADGARRALWASPWAASHYNGGAGWPHYERQ